MPWENKSFLIHENTFVYVSKLQLVIQIPNLIKKGTCGFFRALRWLGSEHTRVIRCKTCRSSHFLRLHLGSFSWFFTRAENGQVNSRKNHIIKVKPYSNKAWWKLMKFLKSISHTDKDSIIIHKQSTNIIKFIHYF